MEWETSAAGLLVLLMERLFGGSRGNRSHLEHDQWHYQRVFEKALLKFTFREKFRLDDRYCGYDPVPGKPPVDQIWFFGMEETDVKIALSDGELNLLRGWMDEGLGVFACGDHGRIGAALCGEIPRVRFMQKWHSENPGMSITSNNRSANSSLRPGRDNPLTPQLDESLEVRDDDQSDDVPMLMEVATFGHYHLALADGHRDWIWQLPHPLLSKKSGIAGKVGVINAFPDHKHEGEVIAGLTPETVAAGMDTFGKRLTRILKKIDEEKPRISKGALTKMLNQLESDIAKFVESRATLKEVKGIQTEGEGETVKQQPYDRLRLCQNLLDDGLGKNLNILINRWGAELPPCLKKNLVDLQGLSKLYHDEFPSLDNQWSDDSTDRNEAEMVKQSFDRFRSRWAAYDRSHHGFKHNPGETGADNPEQTPSIPALLQEVDGMFQQWNRPNRKPPEKSEPLSWQVIATAWSRDNKKPFNAPRKYGVVGAYNGHLTSKKLGRIVVDASFHHWVDVNITGNLDRQSSRPPKFLSDRRKYFGFRTEQGQKYLEGIRSYHRNVALWLAPPEKQKAMALRAMWGALDLDEVKEVFRRPNWEIRVIGQRLIGFLSTEVGETQVRSWWLHFVPENLQPQLTRLVAPCMGDRCRHMLKRLDEFMLGGIFYKLLQLQIQRRGALADIFVTTVEARAREGIGDGFDQFKAHLRRERKNIDHVEAESV